MGALHRPPPGRHPFPTVGDWWRRALETWRARSHAGDPGLPKALVDWCEDAFQGLESSPAPAVVLHGDLHHRNVLSAARDPWLAIDPKGVVGDPGFEAGAFLRNPIPELMGAPDLPRRLARRLEALSDATGLDVSRLAAWGAVGSVLSAIWSLQADGATASHSIACAEHLARVVDPRVPIVR
jgi:streptomycin 6-kinase